MTYLELVVLLRQKCRIPGTGPDTLSDLNADETRLAMWVNEAWLNIQRLHEDWRFLRASAACRTVAGQVNYSASTDFGLTDFAYWALDYEAGDTFRNYVNPEVTITIATPGVVSLAGHNLTAGKTVKFATTGALPTGLTAGTTYYVIASGLATDSFQVSATAGGAAVNTSGSQSGTHTMTTNDTTSFVGFNSEVAMTVWDYDRWRNCYLYSSLRSTFDRPMVVAMTPDNNLACGPIAAAGYTLVGDYYRIPTDLDLADDDDTPSLPTQFHWAIIYKAMMLYGASEAAPEVYDDGANEFATIIRQMERTQLRRLTMPGALA